MDDLKKWLESLQCPDCQSGAKIHQSSAEEISCTQCGRFFERSEGIWDMLPTVIPHQEGKEKEKEGWQRRFEDERQAGWDPPAELFLQLPYYPYPYYEDAARYLEVVLEYGKPWSGKRVLEVGAAESWATRHFAEVGADAAALDYDPSRMIKAQIILDSLPIHFLRVKGDGERLPFRAKTFDCVFCCSVLHHFFDFPQAVKEISRTLKPGGVFLAIHEAFHPPHYTEEMVLRIHQDTLLNMGYGINEGSFTAAYYRQVFRKEGMKLDFINPRWDTRREGLSLIVKKGTGIYDNPDFIPYSLEARAGRKNLTGLISRFLLRSRLWRLAANPIVFPLIRFHILNWTTKERIIAARKPL